MPEGPADSALAVRARDGDGHAFTELVRRHQERVYRIIYRILRNRDEAEDVTQVTFVRAFRSLLKYKEEFPFHPWLYRIAVNTSFTQLAKRKREKLVDIEKVPERLVPRPGGEESALEAVERREMVDRIRKALPDLPEEQRLVFLLRVNEGLSYDQIAETLEIPRGTVMSRLSRAREALRKRLV
ncbi:MAG: RNA polymerase sigma factor, sigma-70 family [bacterium]|nr:MAG: RNA polymerase sigma factor, sigma-70 family [bacterium]